MAETLSGRVIYATATDDVDVFTVWINIALAMLVADTQGALLNGFGNVNDDIVSVVASYIEAHCVEEAKNLYRALTLQQDYVDSDECVIKNVDCLGVYTEECGEPQFAYLAFEDRPREYQRRVHHIGDRVQDLFAITDKQWEAIEHLSKATKSKFTGITKREASEFISKKVKEVSEWKKAHAGRRNYSYKNRYNRGRYYDGQEEDANDCCISWLDLCGDM